jgi:nondiscriminating glutamyl-tRNA synthetase
MGEIIDLSGIFFLDPPVLDEAAKTELRDENAVLVLEKFIEKVKSMPLFDAGEIQNAIFDIQAETGVRGRKLYMPIRIGTTRKSHGPELAASVELLGRKKALAHLEQTLTEMKNLK